MKSTKTLILYLIVSAHNILTPPVILANEKEVTASSKAFILNEPEEEIQYILSSLHSLNRTIETSNKLHRSQNKNFTQESLKKAYSNSIVSFNHKMWKSTIDNLNNYLNWSQIPEPDQYLNAQYMLGYSYDNLNLKKKAIRAYLRYISSFITSSEYSNNNRLHEILIRILALAQGDNLGNKDNIDMLLSALANIELPIANQLDTLYFAARIAALHGKADLASEWFSKIESSSKNKRLKAKSLYQNGLLYIHKRNYVKAETLLFKSLSINSSDSDDVRNLARISLARVFVHRKKAVPALKHYNKIDKNSFVYKDALFEMIYLNLELKRNKKALDLALEYINLYSKESESYHIRSLISYLYLKSGNLAEAKKNITKAEEQLNNINKWLKENFIDKTSLTKVDIQNLRDFTNSHIKQAPIMMKSSELFNRYDAIQSSLSDLRSNIRYIIYTLGRTQLNTLHPQWNNRSKQIHNYVINVLELGHRLVSLEKSLYTKRLNSVDKAELSASEKRRLRNKSKLLKLKRSRGDWELWSSLALLNRRIGNKHKRLKDIQAKISSSLYLSFNSKNMDAKHKYIHMENMQARAIRLEKAMNRAIEIIRSRQILNIIDQSPHHPTKALAQDYAGLLYDESLILTKYRNQFTNINDKYLSDELSQAWKLWTFVIKRVYDHLNALDNDIKTTLKVMLKKLDTYVAKHDLLVEKSNNYEQNLSIYLGKKLQSLLSHYHSQVEIRKSKLQKWKADIDWVKYVKLNEKRKNIENQYDLEEQILQENLKDLQQGALWKWPL